MNASDALLVGLADYRLTHESKQQVLATLLQQPWSDVPDANDALLHRVLRESEQAADASQFAPSSLREHFDLINQLCSAPTPQETVAAMLALETEQPWWHKAQANLKAGAPGSALLSLELQRRVRHRSLAEVFRLELVVALHCAARPDFVEGIRALIIDKDNQPQWQPKRLEDASPTWLQGFFADPWTAEAHPLADLT